MCWLRHPQHDITSSLSLSRLVLIGALCAAPAVAQFPTGSYSVSFNGGATGTLDVSGPSNGSYTVKLTVGGISTTQKMKLKDGQLVGFGPLMIIQVSSTSGDCIKLGLVTTEGEAGGAQKGC